MLRVQPRLALVGVVPRSYATVLIRVGGGTLTLARAKVGTHDVVIGVRVDTVTRLLRWHGKKGPRTPISSTVIRLGRFPRDGVGGVGINSTTRCSI